MLPVIAIRATMADAVPVAQPDMSTETPQWMEAGFELP
jgi:hypothetical protein